jgi:hypothetical protein
MSETREDRRRREEAARQQEAEARQRERREEAIEKKKALARMMAERRVAYQERRTALLVGPQATARSEDGLRTDGPRDLRPSDETPDARRYREEVEDRETFEKCASASTCYLLQTGTPGGDAQNPSSRWPICWRA